MVCTTEQQDSGDSPSIELRQGTRDLMNESLLFPPGFKPHMKEKDKESKCSGQSSQSWWFSGSSAW